MIAHMIHLIKQSSFIRHTTYNNDIFAVNVVNSHPSRDLSQLYKPLDIIMDICNNSRITNRFVVIIHKHCLFTIKPILINEKIEYICKFKYIHLN